jgi:hypothetical protein
MQASNHKPPHIRPRQPRQIENALDIEAGVQPPGPPNVDAGERPTQGGVVTRRAAGHGRKLAGAVSPDIRSAGQTRSAASDERMAALRDCGPIAAGPVSADSVEKVG